MRGRPRGRPRLSRSCSNLHKKSNSTGDTINELNIINETINKTINGTLSEMFKSFSLTPAKLDISQHPRISQQTEQSPKQHDQQQSQQSKGSPHHMPQEQLDGIEQQQSEQPSAGSPYQMPQPTPVQSSQPHLSPTSQPSPEQQSQQPPPTQELDSESEHLLETFTNLLGQLHSELKCIRQDIAVLKNYNIIPMDNKIEQTPMILNNYSTPAINQLKPSIQNTVATETFITPTRVAKQPPHNSWDITMLQNTCNRYAPLANGNKQTYIDPQPSDQAPPSVPINKPTADNNNKTIKRNRRPQICCTESHLNNFIPVRPGKATYAAATKRGRKIMVISDSMMQRIRKKEFYQNINHGFCSIKCFPGATPKHMSHYSLPHLIEEAPNSLIVHSGTNSIHNKDKTPENIADEVIQMGTTARSFGVENVLISGLVQRNNGMVTENKRKEVNRFISDKCSMHGFIYIDNNNISLEDIDSDRVHLHESGSVKLANNILNALNHSY